MVKSNDVGKIVFITNQTTVEITLKQEAFQNAKYKTELENQNLFGISTGPHYILKNYFSSADKFDEYYSEFIIDNKINISQQVPVEFDKRTTCYGLSRYMGILNPHHSVLLANDEKDDWKCRSWWSNL